LGASPVAAPAKFPATVAISREPSNYTRTHNTY
jgi:hypothetical protein